MLPSDVFALKCTIVLASISLAEMETVSPVFCGATHEAFILVPDAPLQDTNASITMINKLPKIISFDMLSPYKESLMC
jgi:hypothetical protein